MHTNLHMRQSIADDIAVQLFHYQVVAIFIALREIKCWILPTIWVGQPSWFGQ